MGVKHLIHPVEITAHVIIVLVLEHIKIKNDWRLVYMKTKELDIKINMEAVTQGAETSKEFLPLRE